MKLENTTITLYVIINVGDVKDGVRPTGSLGNGHSKENSLHNDSQQENASSTKLVNDEGDIRQVCTLCANSLCPTAIYSLVQLLYSLVQGYINNFVLKLNVLFVSGNIARLSGSRAYI